MKRLSVVITSHNYAAFLPAAVESALAQDWHDVEVIVVDDGSTDRSRQVLRAYGDRVVVVLQDHLGQSAAAKRGFSVSTGDVVVFLDADDVLPPGLARAVAQHSSPSTSKWQFSMRRMSADGAPFGRTFPALRRPPTPGQLREWFVVTSAYPTPPGSANAYSRWFLEEVLEASRGTGIVGDAADSMMLAAAPLLGDVVVVDEVVVGYRRHGDNDSRLLGRDGWRFGREVDRALARWAFAREIAQRAENVPVLLPDAPLRSREVLQLRVAARRLGTPSTAMGLERRRDLVFQVLRSPWHRGPEPLLKRLMIVIWCLGMLGAPRPVVYVLLRARYAT